jgi:hypothetical protein
MHPGSESRGDAPHSAPLVLAFVCGFAWAALARGSAALRPMRLLTVALHEIGHAVSAAVCGGHVHAVEVDQFEGGVTVWTPPRAARWPIVRGAVLAIVLPSGYLGVSAWSALLLSGLAGGDAFTRAALGAWTGALATGALLLARRSHLRVDAAWMLLSCAAAAVCIARPGGLLTWHYLLANGAFVGVHATWDVHDDTVHRVLRGSDASVFAARVLGDESRSRAVGRGWTAVCALIPIAAAGVSLLRLDRAGGPPWLTRGTEAALWGPQLLLAIVSAIGLAATCTLRPRHPAPVTPPVARAR